MKIKQLIILSLIPGLAITAPFSWLFPHPNHESYGSRAWFEKEVQIIQSQTTGLDNKVLRLSLTAYLKARKKGMDNKQLLTIIDYSKPSTEKRLWVFDLKNNKELFHTWVSHGKNTGDVNATSFSNKPGSLKSSIGVFVTDNVPYQGGNGFSLRMHGLEPGVNDKAYDRDIVFHGARYVNPATIKQYGRIGRSWGCPAVDEKITKPLINTIKENTLVFAYYPDRQWLSNSKYLA